ncbi:MAG TPA: hypothetical protein DDW52_19715 [Planctomycetaceae bacterium]|nr:hypothetical protein [Planctomycetaceae bacterium]
MTSVVHVPAMVMIEHQGQTLTRQINLIGIDTDTYADVSDFSKYLLHPENKQQLSFLLRETGYAEDGDLHDAGWEYRRLKARRMKELQELRRRNEMLIKSMESAANEKHSGATGQSGESTSLGEPSPVIGPPAVGAVALGAPAISDEGAAAQSTERSAEPEQDDGTQQRLAFPASPFGENSEIATVTAPSNAVGGSPLPEFDQGLTTEEEQAAKFDAETQQWAGIVMGISIASIPYRQDGEVLDYYYARPGDDVRVTFPSAGAMTTAVHEKFTIVDFYESKMSEYDSTFAFVPIDRLQSALGMVDEEVSSIQLKLKEGADLAQVRDLLQATYPPGVTGLEISTWRDLQGPLLAAVQMETTILNILLFLIIAVAGFGILATFFMIVVEKTKDIGILKSLGAGGYGVASIFLGYGVLLGAFGAGVGAIAGLVFVANINTVADVLEGVTGREVFDPTIYYFETIPTIVHPSMVVSVIIGAIIIAVLASVLPSIRAARMHPVRALRYE